MAASELIDLQTKALALQDEEFDLDERQRQLEEELHSLNHLHEEDETRRVVAANAIQYLNMLSSVVKSKSQSAGLLSVAGEIRVQISKKESIVLEVGSETTFGDVVEEVLDYLSYPRESKTGALENSPRPNLNISREEETEGGVRIRNDSRDVPYTGLRFEISDVRPRSHFSLQDEFGAIFCNENKVAETFSSSAVLWMAYLIARPDIKGTVFDPEEEIASFFSSPENVDWLEENGNEATVLNSANDGIQGESELRTGNIDSKRQHGLFEAYDQDFAVRTARTLLREMQATTAYSTRGDSEQQPLLLRGSKKNKQLKKRTIAEANDKRNQSRRQGLLIECLSHLTFVLFCFFTSYVYCGYTDTDPEYIALVYQRDLAWNLTMFPTLESYFQNRIAPFKQYRLGLNWISNEVRLRQLRVNCTDYTQCARYSLSSAVMSLTEPFSMAAANDSTDPASFYFQYSNSDNLVVSLSDYWDNLNLVTDYDATGGYFKFWPSPQNISTLPDFQGWIDSGTAFVAVEFNMYEANSDIVVSAKVVAQYPSYRQGFVPQGLNVSEICQVDPAPVIEPVILVRTSRNIASVSYNDTTMTILCAFAIALGLFSILRGLGLLQFSVSGDRDIAKAVEVYKPNAGLLRSAMMALSVAKSERSFNPSSLSRLFWLLLDSCIMALLIAALVYQYVVVGPAQHDIALLFNSPTTLVPSTTSNYTEVYGIMRDANTVSILLAYASWLAVYSGIRELRLISSGVLIADTVTQSILPGLAVLFLCGYVPMGVAFSSIGYFMFGYLSSAFKTLEMSAYTVVSKYFFFDIVIAPTWRPIYTLLILFYYTVTSAIAYSVVFDAFKRESSKLVKGPFKVAEVLWPFPAIRSWMKEGFRNDLWSSSHTVDSKDQQNRYDKNARPVSSGLFGPAATTDASNMMTAQVPGNGNEARSTGLVQSASETGTSQPYGTARSHLSQPIGPTSRKDTIARSDFEKGETAPSVGMSYRESNEGEAPDIGEDVAYRRGSVASLEAIDESVAPTPPPGPSDDSGIFPVNSFDRR